MRIRKTTVSDIDLLIKLRIDYLLEDRGSLSGDEVKVITQQLRYYFTKYLANGEFIGFIAEADGEVASTAFLSITERPANPAFITGKTGTLLNVLTYPKHRRKGCATKVITAIIDEAIQLGVSSIDLQATGDGKPLYEKLGFKVSSYTAMRLKTI